MVIAEKVWNFFRSRSLKYRVADNADIVVSSNDENNLNMGLSFNIPKLYDEARGKMKNSGHLIGLIVAKAALVGILIFKGIVLLVGKALLVSKLAFLLSSIIALKKLFSKKYVTYEVVAHPTHEHAAEPISGWGRALDGFLETIQNELEKDKKSHK